MDPVHETNTNKANTDETNTKQIQTHRCPLKRGNTWPALLHLVYNTNIEDFRWNLTDIEEIHGFHNINNEIHK